MWSKRSLLGLIVVLFLSVSLVKADVIVPPPTSNAFIQTSGPNSPIGNGDYRTNVAGDNLPHEITVYVPCIPNVTFSFDLFDPEVNDATATVIDEVRPTSTPANADDAFFELIAPTGASIGGEQTYAPAGGTDNTWVVLQTVVMPAVPVDGVNCGLYTVHARVANDDENAWRFRLSGVNGVTPFDTELGLDGVAGTGDEAWIGLQAVSYQHTAPGNQNFYWFADDGAANMYMLNFDIDNTVSVNYTAPDGTPINGTESGGAVWNNTTPTLARPGFGAMTLFDMTAPGPYAGDGIVSPPSGLWSATINVGGGNQYSFEVPNSLVFLDPPDLPDIQVTKNINLLASNLNSPGIVTYSLLLTNVGTGGALPIGGVEVVDTLPAGLTFDSCAVNAPLIGTCNHAGGGVIEFQLQGQTGIPAYLPGTLAAGSAGTLTVSALIDAGLADGTVLTNNACADWTDVYGNDFEPACDDMAFTLNVPSAPAMTVVKSGSQTLAEVGDTITYSYVVTNTGNVTLTNLTLTDDQLGPITLAQTTLTVGQSTTATVDYTIQDGDLPLTNVVTAQADGPAGPVLAGDSFTVVARTTASTTTAPVVAFVDPFITKSVNPPFAVPGEAVVWTITVFNPGGIAATNISITDTMPAEVIIENVSASGGQVSQNGQTISLSIASLGAGQSVTITVSTRVREDLNPPYIIRNIAVMDGPVYATAEATVLSVSNLPNTGETPFWRLPIVLVIAGLGVWAALQWLPRIGNKY